MIRYLLSLLASLLVLTSASFAQQGPGGVLSSTENRFWFSTSFEKYLHQQSVEIFSNQGGSGIDATATSFQEPKFNNAEADLINGYPSLSFDGVNDRFSIPSNSDLTSVQQSKRTYYFVFKTGGNVTSTQVIYDEGNASRGLNVFINNGSLYSGFYNLPNDGVGAPWGFYDSSASISANTLYILAYRFEGKNGTNGNVEIELNGTAIGTITNVGLLYPHVGMVSIGATQGNTYLQSGSSGGAALGFKGEFLEFIYYDQLLNDVEFNLITNYLSSKFDIPIDSAVDLYVNDESANGDFDYDFAGIGRVNGSIINDDAQGTGIVRISNPSNFNNDEYLMWAHDNGAAEATEVSDIPVGVTARFDRVWRVNEVDDNLNAVDVGNIDMQWDLSDVSAIDEADLVLLVDTDNDGSFADETYITGATDLGGSVYEFSAVSELANNTSFTVGTLAFALLPVEFGEINARANGASSAMITWSTYTESNNDYFTVERSTDLLNWQPLGQVLGNGTTSAQHNYSFVDFSPVEGLAYYRIKQVDFSGQYDYSNNVGLVFAGATASIRAYPNPVTNQLNITVDSGHPDWSTFHLQNILGQDCRSLIGVISTTENQLILDMSACPEGHYYFSLNGFMTKILVVH